MKKCDFCEYSDDKRICLLISNGTIGCDKVLISSGTIGCDKALKRMMKALKRTKGKS